MNSVSRQVADIVTNSERYELGSVVATPAELRVMNARQDVLDAKWLAQAKRKMQSFDYRYVRGEHRWYAGNGRYATVRKGDSLKVCWFRIDKNGDDQFERSAFPGRID